MARLRHWTLAWLVAGAAASTGCTLIVAANNGDGDGDVTGDGDGDVSGDGDGDGDISGDGDGDAPEVEGPVPETRLPRLSHGQWERAVRDLLYLPADTTYIEELRSDPNPGGAFFVQHGELRVDQALWQGYQRAAEFLAADVVADAALVAQLAPDSGDNEARIDTFIRTHGARAHRRPLADDQVAAYRALFDAAAGYYPATDGLDAFHAGMRAVIEAWLQSPWFLYRPELVETVDEERIALDAYEMASRLSFALWGSMPDEALFDAAEQGALSTADQVEAEAVRLLADARAQHVIGDFHDRLFEVDNYAQIQPPASLGASAGFGAALAEEHRQVVRGVFARGEGLGDLLTTTTTYVNDELAAVYGLEGDFEADTFTEVELDGATRKGVLTMAGFLADNAAGGAPDPIHRGVFISSRLVCNDVPAPPDDIPPYPAPEGTTNRELVASLTEIPGTNCADCHTTIINPYGFPFEYYDALGAYQETDNGFPVDGTSMVWLGQEQVSVNNGVELVEAMAASQAVHECYAGHWLSFLYGRERDLVADAPAVERVGELSLAEHASIVDLIVGLVRSDAFRYRSATELPDPEEQP